jgi:hypothetical protein
MNDEEKYQFSFSGMVRAATDAAFRLFIVHTDLGHLGNVD